jgi:hypothetical protein
LGTRYVQLRLRLGYLAPALVALWRGDEALVVQGLMPFKSPVRKDQLGFG